MEHGFRQACIKCGTGIFVPTSHRFQDTWRYHWASWIIIKRRSDKVYTTCCRWDALWRLPQVLVMRKQVCEGKPELSSLRIRENSVWENFVHENGKTWVRGEIPVSKMSGSEKRDLNNGPRFVWLIIKLPGLTYSLGTYGLFFWVAHSWEPCYLVIGFRKQTHTAPSHTGHKY